MLSLGRIQMLLYFSLEDDGKKMAGTGVVSQSGTDLEPGLKIYCSSWGRVRPSEWTHIKIQGLHAAHSQPILNKILKARTWLLLTRSHHLYLFRYFWMDGDMRATWVVQGHGGGWPWHKTDSSEDTIGHDGTYTAYLFPSHHLHNLPAREHGFFQIGNRWHLRSFTRHKTSANKTLLKFM